MLDGERPIKPTSIKDQVPWEKAEAVVILVQMPNGEHNRIFMSSLSWNEAMVLSKQFDSHITHHIGPMLEGV